MAGNNPILGTGGIHHVAVRTHDLDASVKFYTGVLGMKIVTAFQLDNAGSFVHLDTGDGSLLELVEDGQPVEPTAERAAHWHLCLGTDRIEEVVAAVKAAGIEVTVPKTDLTLTNTATDPPSPLPISIAFFTGPSGELVELFQDGAAAD